MDYEVKVKELFDTNEINRLHRCAKNKDKKEIIKWGQQFEQVVREKYLEEFKKYYLKQYEERLKDLDTAVLYTLHFNESCNFGNKRLKSVMDDLAATIKGFYNNEYDRNEYRQMLKDDGIKIEDF